MQCFIIILPFLPLNNIPDLLTNKEKITHTLLTQCTHEHKTHTITLHTHSRVSSHEHTTHLRIIFVICKSKVVTQCKRSWQLLLLTSNHQAHSRQSPATFTTLTCNQIQHSRDSHHQSTTVVAPRLTPHYELNSCWLATTLITDTTCCRTSHHLGTPTPLKFSIIVYFSLISCHTDTATLIVYLPLIIFI